MKTTTNISEPERPADETSIKMAIEALAKSDEVALAVLDRLVEQHPLDPRLRLLRGAVHANSRRSDEARQDFARCVELDDSFSPGWFMLGFLELMHGGVADAQRYWEKLLQLPADNPFRLCASGLDLLVSDEPERAIAQLNSALVSTADFPPLNDYVRALIHAIESSNHTVAPVAAPPAPSGHHLLLAEYLATSTRH